jgi:hypothetical protein
MEKAITKLKSMKTNDKNYGNSPSCVYVLGFIGSAIYFVSQAAGFWTGVVGVLKAIVWPAFMAYDVFTYLNA